MTGLTSVTKSGSPAPRMRFDFSRILFFTAIGSYTVPELAAGDSRQRISERWVQRIGKRARTD